MQVDGKVYKVIFLEKATITECNIEIKQYSSDMYHKRYLLKRAWIGLLAFLTFKLFATCHGESFWIFYMYIKK